MKKLWFKEKTYGWGWTPATWQGWAVIAGYLAGVLLLSSQTESFFIDFLWLYFVLLAFMTILLIYICYKTGEKPHWNWGKKGK